jgi:hypothetical protein
MTMMKLLFEIESKMDGVPLTYTQKIWYAFSEIETRLGKKETSYPFTEEDLDLFGANPVDYEVVCRFTGNKQEKGEKIETLVGYIWTYINRYRMAQVSPPMMKTT